jgi:hypothetical protein
MICDLGDNRKFAVFSNRVGLGAIRAAKSALFEPANFLNFWIAHKRNVVMQILYV